MESQKNFYEILGVPVTADLSTIKQTYKRLALQHHPDKSQQTDPNDDIMKCINEAYRTLSNDDLRKAYDSKVVFVNTTVKKPCTARTKETNTNNNNIRPDFSMFDEAFQQFMQPGPRKKRDKTKNVFGQCLFLLSKGKRKGQPCLRDIFVPNHTRCSRHFFKRPEHTPQKE